jgi:hypothetical protein
MDLPEGINFCHIRESWNDTAGEAPGAFTVSQLRHNSSSLCPKPAAANALRTAVIQSVAQFLLHCAGIAPQMPLTRGDRGLVAGRRRKLTSKVSDAMRRKPIPKPLALGLRVIFF